MNETTIIKELYRFFANYDYRLHNTFIYQWESDFFCVSSSGYAIEVEVKISKADFNADFKKTQKHKLLISASKELVCIPGETTNYILENGKYRLTDDISSTPVTFVKPITPNRFYYCCPKDVLEKSDIPEYAGLLYLIDEPDKKYLNQSFKEIKPAKFLHKNKYDLSRILLEKFYYLSNNQKYEIAMLRHKIDELNKYYTWHPDYGDDISSKTIITLPYFEQDLFIDQKL